MNVTVRQTIIYSMPGPQRVCPVGIVDDGLQIFGHFRRSPQGGEEIALSAECARGFGQGDFGMVLYPQSTRLKAK